ncbi:MAG: type VII secretion protein EccB [Phycicoccus sp.]|nr:type VII secretion protein EccB [Phycicoccus sp.]
MPTELSTKEQVRAYRHGVRRVTTAVTGDTAFLIRADSAHGTWLVQSGHRSGIELAESALVAGPGPEPSQVRTVSLTLLNAIPAQPALTRSQIPQSGRSITFGDSAFTIGEVLAVTPASGRTDYQLVLQDGSQQISPVVADAIQATPGLRLDWQENAAGSVVGVDPVSEVPLLPTGPVLDPEAARQNVTAGVATGG